MTSWGLWGKNSNRICRGGRNITVKKLERPKETDKLRAVGFVGGLIESDYIEI